ncbi:hypothetical protein [Pseudomonas cedrina]|uniref:hypothetical protein n=1 Tax=Pseudomonas cedrina TaxID=651740 RepID=UPI00277DA56D|nr:hypothetical protein [Pseudomonas cedrina]MDQ0655128.1 hypothetical protein [Pseudomonas cedrina]
MSVYHRFYVKTKYPRQVEQIIISILGGDAWLYPNGRGEFLRPVSVVHEGKITICPARDVVGNLVDLQSTDVIGTEATSTWFAGVLSRLRKRVAGPEEVMSPSSGETRWYWLDSMIDCDSPEARQVARGLYVSELVDVVAEDNDVSGDRPGDVARIINVEHYLVDTTTG